MAERFSLICSLQTALVRAAAQLRVLKSDVHGECAPAPILMRSPSGAKVAALAHACSLLHNKGTRTYCAAMIERRFFCRATASTLGLRTQQPMAQ